MTQKIFVAGASRGVGREIALRLVRENYKVTALWRSLTPTIDLEELGIDIVRGDALNLSEMEAAMQTEEPITAVISTIGGLPQDGIRADYLGNRNLIDAAVKAGINRFILVSSIGAGESAAALSPQVLQTLGAVLVEKEKAEQHLMASGLTYTIIRPGGLKSEPGTGNGVLTQDTKVSGMIHRADVADLVCQCLGSVKAENQVFSAIDRHQLYTQVEFSEFKLV
ncbi:SDR family oxidoreductase [Merismopedia glauca]|uniref:NAD(P)-dependent oxidoreductase n=1 Tax=Merismopedia glauca CCAP 1448/3 TaxID=1296344 RepID=A0A2T1BYW8_9CYAN|nr:SDR family oxidoreductase [Merismopedia glauca]PSB01230.1 NAD(P)-dependent oxidoreductase [Merismopedia glauca CCAP 1448/3]